MNNYIHVLDVEGKRITSIVIDVLTKKDKALEQAKNQYPDAYEYVYGDDTMLDEFFNGKIYKNGTFVEPPVIESIPTKSEKIANIKKYYDERFATLDKALVRRRLINGDITDLQEQYKKLNAEMIAKIKAVE